MGLKLAASSSLEFIGAKVTTDHKGGFKTVKGGATLGEKWRDRLRQSTD